ncbi:MAG: MFS transporter [Myxococcota bacterium]|nr:MFS transporter [Myxococcota bacterium]
MSRQTLFKKISPDFTYLLMATMFFGLAGGIFQSSFNNYLSDMHGLDATSRGWIELPREFPGFLMMFVSAVLLFWLRETRMAAAAMLLTGLGALGLGFWARDTFMLVVFIVIWSLGDHIIFAVEGPIGLKLARAGGAGRRLGQIGAARNIGGLLGGGGLFLLATTLGNQYDLFYAIAAASAVIAGICYFRLKVGNSDARSRRIVFKKKYAIFYAISALFGVRKQIFLAFGGWVLVTIHDVPVETIALLIFISQVLGIFMRPLLGDVIDWIGERMVLSIDEVLLLLICLTYAFAGDVLPSPYSLYALYGAYVLDSILFALRIARTTYLQKIADDPADITPTVSMGITIDHCVAMSLPILSGYVWERYGFRAVFLIAAAIAAIGFFICLRIRIPEQK